MRKIKRQHEHLLQLVNQLELQVFGPLFNQEYVDQGHWDHVSYDIGTFLEHIEESHAMLGDKATRKFLDVGCGVGTKVQLASMHFDAYGVELYAPYAKVARKLTRSKTFHKYGRHETEEKPKKRIFTEDALHFNYSQWDVIYFFRPMSDDKMQTQLERRIYQQMRPGAIVIPIYKVGELPENIRHIKTPSQEIYVKVRNREHAKTLQKKADDLFYSHK